MHLFTQMLYYTALPEFNQSMVDYFNLVDLQLIFTLLYDYMGFSGPIEGRSSTGEMKLREFCAAVVEPRCHAPVSCLAERQHYHLRHV